MDEYLFADDLIDLFGGWLGLGARLILITVFDGRGLGQLESLVGVVKLSLVRALLAVEVGRALLLRVLSGWRLCDFDLGWGVLFQRHACPHARENWRYFGWVFWGFGSKVFVLRLFQLWTVCAEPISWHLNFYYNYTLIQRTLPPTHPLSSWDELVFRENDRKKRQNCLLNNRVILAYMTIYTFSYPLRTVL